MAMPIDDNEMMKQIQATHELGGYEFDVKPLLQIVNRIFQLVKERTKSGVPSNVDGAAEAQLDALDEKAVPNGFHDMLKRLSSPISRISCQMSCKCPDDGDAHATTLAIFKTLSSYSWDAKFVLALAAFSVNYGDFCLVADLYPTNPLGKWVKLLKQLPERPKSEELINKLMEAVLDVANCIVEFKELPSKYISPDTPEMLTATAYFPSAVYWTIRSIVACASQFLVYGEGQKYKPSTTEAWDLSTLTHRINSIYDHLKNQLKLCRQHINAEKQIEEYNMLLLLFKTIHIDNMKIIKRLINAKDDQLPLFDGSAKKRVSLDILRKKTVLLFISDIEIAHEDVACDELWMLKQMFQTRTESLYEVVWLPVVDRSTLWNDTKKKQFETLQGMMPWYSMYQHSFLDLSVIKFIKEEWKFNKKPLLVALDPKGKVVNPNAIHMMWIWGNLAFPFTSSREETLWKEANCKIELLADKNVAPDFNWTTDGYVCLYGGQHTEWIRNFTAKANEVAQATGINLETLYVGKRNPNKKVDENISTIEKEKLSHTLDRTHMWFFWVRLENIWHYKVQHCESEENDHIMQDIMTMLCFDESDQGWAVICKGTDEIAKGKGDSILEIFNQFPQWQKPVKPNGFIHAVNDQLEKLQLQKPSHHCNHLILPETIGSIPKRVACAECSRPMEKFIMYRCCTDDEYWFEN